MSTKTTFKRIALVAVAALGFGVLTSVAPASAVQITSSAITAGTVNPTRVGVASAVNVTLTHADVVEGTDTFTVTATLVSKPVGSTGTVLNLATGTATETATRKNGSLSGNSASATVSTGTLVIGAGTGVVSSVFGVALTPDVAGTYTVLVSEGNSTFTAGNRSTTITYTTAGAPTSLTATAVAGAVTSTGLGQIFSLSMKDAAGNATILGPNEAILVSDNSDLTTLYKDLPTSNSNSSVVTALGSSDAHIGGIYYVRAGFNGTVATGTAVLSFTGSGLLPATLTVNVTMTLQATASALSSSTVACTTSANCTGSTPGFSTSGAQSLTFTNTSAFGNASGTSTASTFHVAAVKNASQFHYSSFATVAAATAAPLTAVFTAPAPSTGNTTTVSLGGVTATMTFAAPALTTIKVIGSSSVLSAVGGSTTWNIEADDQYGNAIQFAPVTVAVAGRNTVTLLNLGVTDANGIISYTLKDAGTTGTTDTLTFDSGDTVSAVTATVTYGTLNVSKVSFTGGSTTAGAANVSPTVHAIEADQTPESATQDAEVTVTDASGNLLAGVPVTFTVSDATKLAVTTTTSTVHTGSNGKATAKVFAWIAGTYTVTATAGGVTGTGTYSFANSRPADARVLSASATDGVLTAKVVDRFGNPVSGVTVYASRTSGTGYFGTGISKTSTTTGVDGAAEFTMIGTAEVLVSTLDYNALPGVNAAGQTCALAGNFSCASGATAAVAFTATTAGTSAVNAANVGSSFAPAGVSRVTVSVNNNAAADSATAAADAAAEATDAANAATDAANAAAEAADAATAAAQDAADAVAALATSVEAMVNALKRQITSLTNLVIKIQKKVRA
jgi:hypothetical protein